MTDYLLVHGAGQGAWSWGRVWGYLTAPEEHPPRLYTTSRTEQVYCLDLPGHGANTPLTSPLSNGGKRGVTSNVTIDGCVRAIVDTVKARGLHNLVLVGHGFAAPLVLQAAGRLPEPPRRVVLVAGLVPSEGENMLAVFPGRIKMAFQLLSNLSKLTKQDFKLPRPVIARCLCNGVDPMEVVHVVGHFGPLPTGVLKTKVSLEEFKGRCPITYVVLSQDKLLPAAIQRHMAGRLSGVEVIELDSCHQVMLYQPKRLADILSRYA